MIRSVLAFVADVLHALTAAPAALGITGNSRGGRSWAMLPTSLTASAVPVVSLEAAAPEVARVDVARRTITGIIIPPGNLVASTSAGPTRFAPNALSWVEPRRVKLLHEHQRTLSLGYATSLSYTEHGLVASFHLPPSANPEEEALRLRALADADSGVRDGLSVEAEFPNRGDITLSAEGVLDVHRGVLRAVSLVSVPAFDQSRVTHVAATYGGSMCPSCNTAHAPGTPCATLAPAAAPAAPMFAGAPAPAPAAPAPAAPAPGVFGGVALPTGLTADAVFAEIMDRLRSGQLVPVAGGPTPAGGSVTPPPAGAPPAANTPRELSLQAFTEIVAANYSGSADETMVRDLRAALADITPADIPQAFRPVYLTELWEGSDYRRKFIDNAMTTRPLPRAMQVIGQRWTTRPIVDDYAGNKTDVPTNEPRLEDIIVAVQRLAGAHDVDRAFVDLGSPEWLASYFEAQTEDYRRKSDARAATAVWNGAPDITDDDATPLTADTLLAGVVLAVIELATLGEGVEYVAMAPGLLAELLNITQMDAPAWFSGSFQLGNQGDGSVGGTTWFTSPGLPAGGFIAGSKTAARWHEMEPPIRVQAQNVAQGGIDLGVFGYYAAYLRNEQQLRRGTVGV